MAKFESVCTINIDEALDELEKMYCGILDLLDEDNEDETDGLLSRYEAHLDVSRVRSGWIGLGNGCYKKGCS